MNLYPLYLAGDLLTKRLAAVGLTPMYVMQSKDHEARGTHGMSIEMKIDYYTADREWIGAERREALAAEFTARYPDAEMVRETPAYGAPQIHFCGVTTLGVAWKIEFGETACERVKVGTKRVERVDLDAYAALPKVMVDEPVYEYRCPDPIVAAGLVSA